VALSSDKNRRSTLFPHRREHLYRADDYQQGVLNIQNGSALGTTAAGTTVSSGAALQSKEALPSAMKL